jgi:DNA-binding HxlR family transcriptional regulator
MNMAEIARSEVTALPAGGPNSLAMALGLLGDEWNLPIMRESFCGATRYSDWSRALPVSNAVLSGRLAWLVQAGLLDRLPSSEHAGRFEYRPTSRGRSVWPVLLSMWSWERTWVDDRAALLPSVVRRTCGARVEPRMVCGKCGRTVDLHSVAGGFGPSGTWERSVPGVATRRRAPGVVTAGTMAGDTQCLIGNRWSALLLAAAYLGADRFGDFESTGVPSTVLAHRLRAFTAAGVLENRPGADRADWSEYRLTEKGRDFLPAVVAMVQWGQRWFRSPEGRSIVVRHKDCGLVLDSRLLCSACAGALRGRDIAIGT